MSAVQIDLDTHVLPLLNAVEWMGQASHKLSEIDSLQQAVPEVKRFTAGIPGPDPLNIGQLLGELAWIAADLLRQQQDAV
ncbi:MAG TPA: hypothetical protein VFY31_07205 [Macromonas sp.]|nr:hypothetical protein [Macromonas sp.]